MNCPKCNDMTLNLTILAIMRDIRCFFESDPLRGTFTVENGNTRLNGDWFVGDWLIIADSRRHNGLYQLAEVPELEYPLIPPPPDSGYFKLSNGTNAEKAVADGEFEATIYAVLLPVGFLELAREIHAWREDPANAPSSLKSESEGVVGLDQWSATYATDANGVAAGWEKLFASRLDEWRKMFNSFKI